MIHLRGWRRFFWFCFYLQTISYKLEGLAKDYSFLSSVPCLHMCLCVWDMSRKLIPAWFPSGQPWPTYAPLLPTQCHFKTQAAEALSSSWGCCWKTGIYLETISRNPSPIFINIFANAFVSPLLLYLGECWEFPISPSFMWEIHRGWWGGRASRGRGEGPQQSP